MKYEVTLEFVVNPYGEDKELSQERLIGKADYAINNNLYRYNNLICDTIGFPGYMYVITKEKTL